MKKLPNIEKFMIRSFWKLHKMVAQERTAEAQDGAGKKVQKAAQKCFFFYSVWNWDVSATPGYGQSVRFCGQSMKQ